MTSTNDGKEVKSNQACSTKGKSYFIELYKTLESRLSGDCSGLERTELVCEAWRRIHSLCSHSAPSTHPHLLCWVQRHTALTILQTEWTNCQDQQALLVEAIDAFLKDSEAAILKRDGVSKQWELQLQTQSQWFKRILPNPWDHPVLKALLDQDQTLSDNEILEWLKEECGVMFATRLRHMASIKSCVDLALRLATEVMQRARVCVKLLPDSEQIDLKETTVAVEDGTFSAILKKEAGFTPEVWELITDLEFILLHKTTRRSCIKLAKQVPLRDACQLVERLQNRPAIFPKEKKIWKNAKAVALLIAQVTITRCMVVPNCRGAVLMALYGCTRSMVRLMTETDQLSTASGALAAPAATAHHLHTMAAAVHKQLKGERIQLTCQLYVRAITAGMNELEKLKLDKDKSAEARSTEKTLSTWFKNLGTLLSKSNRLQYECVLTAFSVHPSPIMYEEVKSAPALEPIKDTHEINSETTSEFGSWATDSRTQTNLVKTSETLKIKKTQQQANILSTSIFSEGEALGLDPELCNDLAVLLSGPRVKTLTWDMEREVLLDNCRAYMKRTDFGTRALTTELKFLNLDPRSFQHLPEEVNNEDDIYYGIEKGYEHLVELQEPLADAVPPEIWQEAFYESPSPSSDDSTVVRRRRKKKKIPAVISSMLEDPLKLDAVRQPETTGLDTVEHSRDSGQSNVCRDIDETSKIDKTKVRLKEKKLAKDKKDVKEKSNSREKKKAPTETQPKKEAASNSALNKLVNMKFKNNSELRKLIKHTERMMYPTRPLCSKEIIVNAAQESSNVIIDGLFSVDDMNLPECNLNTNYLTQTVDTINSASRTVPNNNRPISIKANNAHIDDSEEKTDIKKLLEFRRDNFVRSHQLGLKEYSGVHSLGTMAKSDNKLSLGQSEMSGTNLDENILKNHNIPSSVNYSIPNDIIDNTSHKKQNESPSQRAFEEFLLSRSHAVSNVFPPKTKTESQNSLLIKNSNSTTRQSFPTYQKIHQTTKESLPRSEISTSMNNKQLSSASKQDFSSIMYDPSQKNFQGFLKGYHQSINSGTLPKQILETKLADSSVGTKISKTSKIAEHAPNTFSRLSYHKNKQIEQKLRTEEEKRAKTYRLSSATHELSSILPTNLQRAAEIQINRISKKANASNVSTVKKPQQTVPQLYHDHQTLLHAIQTQNSFTNNVTQNKVSITKDINAKNVIIEKSNKSRLSNKDQNDILHLLKQKGRLDASNALMSVSTRSEFTVPGSSNDPSTCTIPSVRNDAPTQGKQQTATKVENTSNSKILDFRDVNKQEIMQRGSDFRTETLGSVIKPCNLNTNYVQREQDNVKMYDTKAESCHFNALKHNNLNNSESIKNLLSVSSDFNIRKPNMINRKLNHSKDAKHCATEKLPTSDTFKLKYDPNRAIDSSLKAGAVKKKVGPKKMMSQKKDDTTSVPVRPNWESVLNDLLKHKTPSRGPNALDVALKKNNIEKNVSQLNDDLNKATAKEIVRNEITNTSDSKPILAPRSKTLQPTTKYFEMKTNPDPFISGIPNSDYDLLDELIDDDLRQEIRELSDDETYSPMDLYTPSEKVTLPGTGVILANPTATSQPCSIDKTKGQNKVITCVDPKSVIISNPQKINDNKNDNEPRVLFNELVVNRLQMHLNSGNQNNSNVSLDASRPKKTLVKESSRVNKPVTSAFLSKNIAVTARTGNSFVTSPALQSSMNIKQNTKFVNPLPSISLRSSCIKNKHHNSRLNSSSSLISTNEKQVCQRSNLAAANALISLSNNVNITLSTKLSSSRIKSKETSMSVGMITPNNKASLKPANDTTINPLSTITPKKEKSEDQISTEVIQDQNIQNNSVIVTGSVNQCDKKIINDVMTANISKIISPSLVSSKHIMQNNQAQKVNQWKENMIESKSQDNTHTEIFADQNTDVEKSYGDCKNTLKEKDLNLQNHAERLQKKRFSLLNRKYCQRICLGPIALPYTPLKKTELFYPNTREVTSITNVSNKQHGENKMIGVLNQETLLNKNRHSREKPMIDLNCKETNRTEKIPLGVTKFTYVKETSEKTLDPQAHVISTAPTSRKESNQSLISTSVCDKTKEKQDISSQDQDAPNFDHDFNKNSSKLDQYKDSIEFEEIPRKSTDCSTKRNVRIKLPNGTVFRATISGKFDININSIFSDPQIKNILLNDVSKSKHCTLNVKQTKIPNDVASKETLVNTILNADFTLNKKETINLISDDESDECQNNVFKTEFGDFNVSAKERDIIEKHQKRFSQKCAVKLENNDFMKKVIAAKACLKLNSACENYQTNFTKLDDYSVIKNSGDDRIDVIEIDDSSSGSEIETQILQPLRKDCYTLKPKLSADLDLLRDSIIKGLKLSNTNDPNYKTSNVINTISTDHMSNFRQCKNTINIKNNISDSTNDHKKNIEVQKCYVKLIRCDIPDVLCNSYQNNASISADTTEKQRCNVHFSKEDIENKDIKDTIDNHHYKKYERECEDETVMSPDKFLDELEDIKENSICCNQKAPKCKSTTVYTGDLNAYISDDIIKRDDAIIISEFDKLDHTNGQNNLVTLTDTSLNVDVFYKVGKSSEQQNNCQEHIKDYNEQVFQQNLSNNKVEIANNADKEPIQIKRTEVLETTFKKFSKENTINYRQILITDTINEKMTIGLPTDKENNKSDINFEDKVVIQLHSNEINPYKLKEEKATSLYSASEEEKLQESHIKATKIIENKDSITKISNINVSDKHNEAQTTKTPIRYWDNMSRCLKKYFPLEKLALLKYDCKDKSVIIQGNVKKEHKGEDEKTDYIFQNYETEDGQASPSILESCESIPVFNFNSLENSKLKNKTSEVEILMSYCCAEWLTTKASIRFNTKCHVPHFIFPINDTILKNKETDTDIYEKTKTMLSERRITPIICDTEWHFTKSQMKLIIQINDSKSSNNTVIDKRFTNTVSSLSSIVFNFFKRNEIIQFLTPFVPKSLQNSNFTNSRKRKRLFISENNRCKISKHTNVGAYQESHANMCVNMPLRIPHDKNGELVDIGLTSTVNNSKQLEKNQSVLVVSSSDYNKEENHVTRTNDTSIEFKQNEDVKKELSKNCHDTENTTYVSENKTMLNFDSYLINTISNLKSSQLASSNYLSELNGEKIVYDSNVQDIKQTDDFVGPKKEKITNNKPEDSETTGIGGNDKITLLYKGDSKVLLKGTIYEDPIIGTCYLFPIRPYIDSGILNVLPDTPKHLEEDIESAALDITLPKVTYSKQGSDKNSQSRAARNLKRKGNIIDFKTGEKRYRKGKNIDYPKIPVKAIKESAYVKEYTALQTYMKAIKFSFSRPFHIENIDVDQLLTSWPIQGQIQAIVDTSNCDDTLFNINDNYAEMIYDPLKQTLSDEISVCNTHSSEYKSNDIDEINFRMGFGEGSDRVLQQHVDRNAHTKISAATLSDVKPVQPFTISTCSHIKTIKNRDLEKNEDEITNRYISYIRLKNKVRTFFKRTSLELNHDWIFNNTKGNKKRVSSDLESNYPFDIEDLDFFGAPSLEVIVQVVQVGQLPVSAAAQNPVTCDPRVTQVTDASPPQCSAENSPRDGSQPSMKTEYTELTTADLSLPLAQDYERQSSQSMTENNKVTFSEENIPIETEVNSIVKIEIAEEVLDTEDQNDNENELQNIIGSHINNQDYCFDANNSNTDIETQHLSFQTLNETDAFITDEETNEKTDQIAHAMNAAGIATNTEPLITNESNSLDNIMCDTSHEKQINKQRSLSNSYSKTTSINSIALHQALAQILPPPLNRSTVTDNNNQTPNNAQVLHIVQGKNSSVNHLLVDNPQQSVINTSNPTPILHIVQNKGQSHPMPSNNAASQNSFNGLSLVEGSNVQQGGSQLLHIVNTSAQKTNNTGQLIKRVNLVTNISNVQGGNEQKMVQFVCKSADGKSIQLNAPHQRSMVLRIQPIESPSVQNSNSKPPDTQTEVNTNGNVTAPNNCNEITNNQQEIKSRSVYEENYAKFIQNSGKPPLAEKSTSLPKFNQAFGKQVFQEENQKVNDVNENHSHLNTTISNENNSECQSENSSNTDHIGQINSPPLLLRKPNTTSQSQTAQPSLVQQLKQTITPMNLQTMHGGVIYTRQIPVNIGGGQTINLITVPSTELIDDSNQKQHVSQPDVEPSIIKITSTYPPNQTTNSEATTEDNRGQTSNDCTQNPQPQPVLTQMRIKLPMLSKPSQMVSGSRVVRPSFFQIQRNVIGGTNQPVYQQLVLTAAPPLGHQTIRLPQSQTNRIIKVPTENQTSPESQMSSSTLEQLREFDMVLEQVKERSTGNPNQPSTNINYNKVQTSATETSDTPSHSSSSSTESTHQVLYTIGNNSSLNVAYVNRKATVTTPSVTSYVRSPDSSNANDSPSSSTQAQLPHGVTTEAQSNDLTSPQNQHKSAKLSSKPKPRPKPTPHPPSSSVKINPVPPKPSTQKPFEDEQTTQRILYILAEYKEQVENSPDKDKPAPRRRSNPPSNPGSSKRKKSSSSSRRPGTRDMSPVHGEDTCRTMGSEDSSCGTSQGDCADSCLDSHSPQDSPRKVVRKLTFENETAATPRPQPQRNVIVADGQTITVARNNTGKPTTAVLMPANYILPVSMVKSGQQIAIVTNRGPKILTVGGGDAGGNAVLLQRLIGPGLKPVLTRPGVRHVRLPAAALQNLQAFTLGSTASQQPDSTAVVNPNPPELIDTRATASPWAERDNQDAKPDKHPSPESTEPWNLAASNEPHDYSYEEIVRSDNLDRTVLDAIPDRYSPDMEAQRIFDKMFDIDSKKSYNIDSQDDSPRCGYDIDASDCDDKPYHQVVHRKDGTTQRHHRLTHVSAAALRHRYAILEHELRLQKSLSEECEDLGVDSPSASELFPEAELLFSSSPAHDAPHHSHTPQPLINQSTIPQPDLDDQIATDQLISNHSDVPDEEDLNMLDGLDNIVTVSGDGTITLDPQEFARSHPNTTFHKEPTDESELQPFTIANVKGRHMTSTIFHASRAPATVLVTAPQTTVISQATPDGSIQNNLKYPDTPTNSQQGSIPSVLVKDNGVSKLDSMLNRELHLSNTASTIIHSGATQVIRRVCYDEEKTDPRFLESHALIGEDAKMTEDSRDATLESMADVDDDRSSPERNTEMFWESNSTSERSEGRRPLDFSSDSDKCCKSPFEETNSTDSSGIGTHIMRLDSVIKDARGIERSGSADGSSADDTHPPLRTYPPKRYHPPEAERSTSGKTRAGERSPDSMESRRRASNRGVVKRGCHCCNGSPAPPKPKKSRPRKPNTEFIP